MRHKHIDVITEQVAKKPDKQCGDVVLVESDTLSTIAVICDGLGSGIQANLIATMTAQRAITLLKNGFTLRKTVEHIAKTMTEAKTQTRCYAAFTIVKILNTGEASILSYEMPAPILISQKYATVLPSRPLVIGAALVQEAHYFLNFGQALIVVSDGLTQAGIGKIFPLGWGIDGICNFLNSQLAKGVALDKLPTTLLPKVFEYDERKYRDDSTVCWLRCRAGYSVKVLTGLPADPQKDELYFQSFLQTEGNMIVAGSSTADALARYLKTPVTFQPSAHPFEPPQYTISGIDLVTEGAVTLNQVYNIVDDREVESSTEKSGVIIFSSLLRFADKVCFWVGSAQNPHHLTLSFRQQGIIPRPDIVPLISQKLQKMGKIVKITTW